jgi:hypothetical protein
MANRYLRQFTKSFDTERVIIDGYGSVNDSIGTPTFTAAAGVQSITRNSAGNYTILLQDSWPAFLSGNVSLVMASGLISATVALVSVDVTVTKKVNFVVVNTSGAAVELPPQSGFYFYFEVKNSGLARGH